MLTPTHTRHQNIECGTNVLGHAVMTFDLPLPSLLIRYELRAIQQEKLKQMAMEEDKSSDNHPYEIEMSEAKHVNFIEPLPPS
ncbi:hypothetical protein L195_g011016 [Trifolium pratense]|uniref:Uncharacterized protein n=1 Tax=Trifolium pratense TaxID=57577 RepID=A0A2K3PGB6_TRIPR|nr:hypothetical protein L195_g001386 [Trifolium pratense]PNY13240.1 hypothetical protein L195_g009890 [Trifolium pratense]PNY14336.1 hypothetical protein L195_g011016 [Trifolium pratense]